MSIPHRDAVAIAPTIYKVLFENDRVRLLEITMHPGDASAMHAHPDNVVYLLSGGTGRFSRPDGSSMDLAMQAGAAFWQPAGAHAVANTGGTEVKAVMVELKR